MAIRHSFAEMSEVLIWFGHNQQFELYCTAGSTKIDEKVSDLHC